ncbi:MAG: type II toxin-antitoxin system VapC family toxin [Desulfobacteraceae bacterium]|nr:type II toxin-antitoxin system VapC family toxin [Desulfobacteraceae bacterium]
MNPKIYVETSIISYLAARPSRDVVALAKQQITIEWWNNFRNHFDLYISQLVIEEAERGDKDAADKRLEIAEELQITDISENALELAKIIMQKANMPKKAENDVLHIAIAATQKMDYLLTWNNKHIANAMIQKILREIVSECGYDLPVICTPNELTGDIYDTP